MPSCLADPQSDHRADNDGVAFDNAEQVHHALARRIVRVRGRRLPREALVTHAEGDLEVSRTAANEYEVRHRGEVVFRAGATGGLSSAPAAA